MKDRTRFFKDILWVLALAGLVAAVLRLWFGLGATTNLSDAMPWGLWKILNMVAGVALSTSGFTVGFLVYVLRLKQFKPFMKPAILVAFLGYGCSCAALLFDIGLPHRFWHPIVMWNFNSFLFEVFWCVLLYFTVTAIELAPTIFEKFRAEKIVRFLHRIATGVVIVGISLSSLHHSSLGSLFLVTPLRLHPLWYSPWLPIFFILSAMGAGMMLIVLLRILYAYWYDPEPVFGPARDRSAAMIQAVTCLRGSAGKKAVVGEAMPRIRKLAVIAVSIMALYTILKVIDLFLHGGWSALLAGTWESWLYLGELLVAAILPMVLVYLPISKRSPAVLGLATFSGAFGLALNRMDVGIFGYFHDAAVVYFPSLVEWALSLGVVAAAGLVFLAVVENFPVFSDRWTGRGSLAGLVRHQFGTIRQLWYTALSDSLHRVTLLAVFVLPIAFILMYPPYRDSEAAYLEVEPAIGLDMDRTELCIDGNRDGISAVFAHTEHQKRLKDSTDCATCHHLSFPDDRSTPCSRCHRHFANPTMIFDHNRHLQAVAKEEKITGWYPVNNTCVVCHEPGRPRTAGNAKDCRECHREDMVPPGISPDKLDLLVADGYYQGMHGTCLPCHEKHEALAEKESWKNLSQCGTCHESLRPLEIEKSRIASRFE